MKDDGSDYAFTSAPRRFCHSPVTFVGMQVFEIKDGENYIELNKLLKITQLAGSGGEANQLIMEGYVEVNGVHETQKRKKLVKGDTVALDGAVVEIR